MLGLKQTDARVSFRIESPRHSSVTDSKSHWQHRLISTRLSMDRSAFVSILAVLARNESASGLGGLKQGRQRLTNASTVGDALDAFMMPSSDGPPHLLETGSRLGPWAGSRRRSIKMRASPGNDFRLVLCVVLVVL